jgi:hypothetical protein
MSESSLDSELLAGAGAKSGGKKRKALSDSSEEEVSSEDVSLDDESELEEMRAARHVSQRYIQHSKRRMSQQMTQAAAV